MDFAVRAVTKRLLVGASAAAEGCPVFFHFRLAFSVHQFESAFYNKRTVGGGCDGYCISSFPCFYFLGFIYPIERLRMEIVC